MRYKLSQAKAIKRGLFLLFFFFQREVRDWVLWKGLFKDNFLQRSSGTPNIHRDILLRTRLSIKKNSLNKNVGLLPCSGSAAR